MNCPGSRLFQAENTHRILRLIALFLVLLTIPGSVTAMDAKEKFHLAETCRQRLMENSKKQQFRHNWISCIEKFNAVYQDDPSGTWARSH